MFKKDKIIATTQSTLVSLSMVKQENPIVINVQGQGRDERVSYCMGRGTPLRYLMLDFCERTGAVFEYARFISSEGLRINPGKTPDDLKMEDCDTIDAFRDQIGG